MVSLISKFKKLKVTDTEPAGLKPQSPWRTCERIIQGKFPKYKKGTDVAVPLSNPETLEPILARADRKEIPGILCKVIDDIHSDRMKGKRLVKEAIQNAKNPTLLEQLTKVAHPVSVTKTSTPNRSWVGQETVETRDLNRQEITQARADFSQGGRSDAEYMFHLYFNGGRHLHLTNQEMQAVALTLENPALHEALTVVLESVVGTYSVWSWVAMAWRYAFPFLDYSQFEGGTTWRNPEEGIKILKKLGVLQCIYDEHTDHPLKTPLTNSVRRLILKGAPSSLQFILQTSMPSYQTLFDLYQYLKDCRDLHTQPKLSFPVLSRPGPLRPFNRRSQGHLLRDTPHFQRPRYNQRPRYDQRRFPPRKRFQFRNLTAIRNRRPFVDIRLAKNGPRAPIPGQERRPNPHFAQTARPPNRNGRKRWPLPGPRPQQNSPLQRNQLQPRS